MGVTGLWTLKLWFLHDRSCVVPVIVGQGFELLSGCGFDLSGEMLLVVLSVGTIADLLSIDGHSRHSIFYSSLPLSLKRLQSLVLE